MRAVIGVKKLKLQKILPSPSGRGQGEGLRICIDFHYALSRLRSARPSSWIPNENPSLVMSFRQEPCELPNCWPSSSNANEKSSVLNEFSRKVNPTSVIHNQMSRKLISNDQFPIRNHNTNQESLVHDWFSRIGNEISAKLIRNAPLLIRYLENPLAIVIANDVSGKLIRNGHS